MTVEGQRGGGQIQPGGQCARLFYQQCVSSVNAVEGAQRDRAAPILEILYGMQYEHQFFSHSMALKRISPSACISPIPAKTPFR